jgi:hypothetical protein
MKKILVVLTILALPVLALAAKKTTLTTPLAVTASAAALCNTAYAIDLKTDKARAVFESCTGTEPNVVYTKFVVYIDVTTTGSTVTKVADDTTSPCTKTLAQHFTDIDNDAKGLQEGLRQLVKDCLGGT